MGENFNNLLTIHHFFNITIDGGKVTLLGDKVLGTGTADNLSGIKHNTDHQKRDKCQRNIEYDHGTKYTDNGYCTVDDLWDTLADHLAESIDIIRVG